MGRSQVTHQRGPGISRLHALGRAGISRPLSVREGRCTATRQRSVCHGWIGELQSWVTAVLHAAPVAWLLPMIGPFRLSLFARPRIARSV
jgi:hypothetical protein